MKVYNTGKVKIGLAYQPKQNYPMSRDMEALQRGGNLPCIMNAANEIAVYAFLRNRINFLDMTHVIETTMQKMPLLAQPTLEEYFESDGEARNFAADIIKL